MGRKRKASRPAEPAGPRDVDAADARLLVNSYEDIADSEEEYFLNKDKIMLDDGPRSKRLKADKEDEMFESSDEEVLAYDESDESDASDDDDEEAAGDKRRKSAADDDELPDDRGYWGASKKEYYEADAVETEADALAEEAEAKRLQQKKLAKMSEADFMFDADEWAAKYDDEEQPEGDMDMALTEALKDVEITDDMGPEELYQILQTRYPEFDSLADELLELYPKLAEYQQVAQDKPSKSLEVVKYRVLGCYVAALSSYFAILTSPARDKGLRELLDPSTLRDHDVMGTLVECREAWLRVKSLRYKNRTPKEAEESSELPSEDEVVEEKVKSKTATKTLSNGDAASKKKKAADKKKLAAAKKLEESLADLSSLLAKPKKRATKTTAAAADVSPDDDEKSDFGDDEVLDAGTAQEKAARKKTLRFYTTQIVQKADKRAGAGRDAGGDMDIPYRERLRDRQARVNAEAVRRGQKSSKYGEELGAGDDDDDDEADVARDVRDDEDDYYDMVAQKSKQKKTDKAARHEALQAASKNDRVVEREEVGEDGKRQLTYHILKNKGLTVKRKKEAKNSRVKKRKKYEEKSKRLKSVRAVYGGGEGRGGYQGELSGIKTGLVKSVKL